MKRRHAGILVLTGLFLVFPSLLKSTAYAHAAANQQQQIVIEDVEIRGNRRIPADTIRLYIQTKKGDVYNEQVSQKDLKAIYAQGFFTDVNVYQEDGPGGGRVVIFQVKERPIIRDIVYVGLKSLLESEVLDEFRKKRVKLSKESLFDPVQVNAAKQVIKQMLADKGKPDSTVDVEVDDISVTTVAIVFNVDEGPRVRVVSIDFEGNTRFSSRQLRRQLKLTKQSSLFTLFSSKDVYSKDKLANDLERLKFYLGTKGYWHPIIGEPKIEEAGEVGSWIPIIGKKGRGLRITIPIEEGKVYRIGKVEISGNTLFSKEQITQVAGFVPGEIANTDKVRKGVTESLKKLYGQLGYVQFNTDISQELEDTPGSNEGTVNFNIEIEEGRPFTLHFLNFLGNHFTRDNVLRREVLLNEGEPFNQTLWELSLLRLNQLGYFNEIKEENANFRFNERDNTMDIDLKVEEKGRQSISFTGGASGVGGSFIGLTYSTNNFLGFGETLSFSVNAGNRQRVFSFSFTEPYLKGKPVSLGFSVFTQRLEFFSGLFGGANSFNGSFFGGLGLNSDQLFTQVTKGGSVTVSSPMTVFTRRWRFGQFARLGLSYSYQRSKVEQPRVNKDFDPNNNILLPFEQPNTTISTITPTFTYNTLDSFLDPTKGTSLTAALNITGGLVGGSVRYLQPTVEWKSFHPGFFKVGDKRTTFGYRVLFGHVRPFGSRFNANSLSFVDGVPIFNRYFLGGENDIRGYEIRSIAPLVTLDTFLVTKNVKATIPFFGQTRAVLPDNSNRFDGSQIAQSVIDHFKFTGRDGKNPFRSGTSIQPIGGDSQLLLNAEYRIPIAGPIAFAAFGDIGSAWNMRKAPEQIITSNFLPQDLTPQALTPFGVFPGVITNAFGQIAKPREQKAGARTPELGTNGLPPGFLNTVIRADTQSLSVVKLNDRSRAGIFDNYRASVGGEVRVEVPVINVPFRLIFAYNPNARIGFIPGTFIEEKRKVIRFSIGRTF